MCQKRGVGELLQGGKGEGGQPKWKAHLGHLECRVSRSWKGQTKALNSRLAEISLTTQPNQPVRSWWNLQEEPSHFHEFEGQTHPDGQGSGSLNWNSPDRTLPNQTSQRKAQKGKRHQTEREPWVKAENERLQFLEEVNWESGLGNKNSAERPLKSQANVAGVLASGLLEPCHSQWARKLT